VRRLETGMPGSVVSAWRQEEAGGRSDPAILLSRPTGAAELDLAALRLGTRTGLALFRLAGTARIHGLTGSDLPPASSCLEWTVVHESGIPLSSRLTECSAVGACAGFPLGVFRERKTQRHQNTGDVDRLRPQGGTPDRWHKGLGVGRGELIFQAACSSALAHPKKREDCLSSEPAKRARASSAAPGETVQKAAGQLPAAHPQTRTPIEASKPATEIS
jgi:hypothetical protein